MRGYWRQNGSWSRWRYNNIKNDEQLHRHKKYEIGTINFLIFSYLLVSTLRKNFVAFSCVEDDDFLLFPKFPHSLCINLATSHCFDPMRKVYLCITKNFSFEHVSFAKQLLHFIFLPFATIRFRFRLHSLVREDSPVELISRRNYKQSFIGSNREGKDKGKEGKRRRRKRS